MSIAPAQAPPSWLRWVESQSRRTPLATAWSAGRGCGGPRLAGFEEDGNEHVVAAEGEVVAFHRVHISAGVRLGEFELSPGGDGAILAGDDDSGRDLGDGVDFISSAVWTGLM